MAANTDKTPDGKQAETEGSKAANIPAATSVDTSGAPQQVVPDVDMSHPAVDDNPRPVRWNGLPGGRLRRKPSSD